MPLTVTSSNEINTPQSPSGYTVGHIATALVGFYGATPVVQQVKPTAPGTTAATTTTPWGFATSTQADAVALTCATLVTRLTALGLIA